MNRRNWLTGFAGTCIALAVGTCGLVISQRDGGGDRSRVGDVFAARSPRELWDALTGETARRREFMLVTAFHLGIQEHQVLTLVQQKNAQNADWPLFGGTPQRNMVNLTAKGVPTEWSVEDGKPGENVKWAAELGTKTYGGPVVADGRVFVGTNNATPRDPAVKGHKAVVMAFDQKTGKFLWQQAHDIPTDETFKEVQGMGLVSTPHVEGGKLYYVTPSCEVVCADAATGKVQWTYDMMKELKVVPYHAANCSPLVVGDLVMVVTGNGVNDEGKLVSPQAPSFIAVHKATGKLAWQSNLPGEAVIEGQWSNPTLAEVNGKPQVIFPGGDCWLYSFESTTGKLIWKCNCSPQRAAKGERAIDNYFVATPVVVGDRLYIGTGVYPEHPQPPRSSYVLCLDVTKTGDVSPKTLKADNPANKGSALVWAFGGLIEPAPKRGRPAWFGRTISTCAVHDGLVYVAEESGYMHCLDAKTGQRHWEYDFKAAVWGSPYYVDGKVYLGTEDGEIVIFQHGKTLKVVNKVDMGELVHSTPVVADNTLFIATRSKLYAIGGKQ